MKVTIAIGMLLGALYSSAAWSTCSVPSNQALIFVSDPYPPYVMDGKAGHQGFVADIVLKVFHEAGYKSAVYVDVPYARALRGIKKGVYTGLLAVAPGRPNYVYPTRSFMGYFRNQFFVRENAHWQWTGDTGSLESITLGIIRGYRENDPLNAYVAKNYANGKRIQVTSGTHALRNLIGMLVAGRIDTFFEDTRVVNYQAGEMHLRDKIRPVGNFNLSPDKNIVTVGFYDKNPCSQHFIDILNTGIPKLRVNGQLQAIIEEYGLDTLATHQ